jgi:hypothetical protein
MHPVAVLSSFICSAPAAGRCAGLRPSPSSNGEPTFRADGPFDVGPRSPDNFQLAKGLESRAGDRTERLDRAAAAAAAAAATAAAAAVAAAKRSRIASLATISVVSGDPICYEQKPLGSLMHWSHAPI